MTAMSRICPGTLVATEATRLNGMTVVVCHDEILERLTVTGEVAAAGWQLAQYRHTESRVLVRVTDQRKRVGSVNVTKVELADVGTGVVETSPDSFAIVATVGDRRPMGWTRTENVRGVR